MKFSVSIPFATVFVLLLTLFINIIGLKFSLEKHFPIYIDRVKTETSDNLNLNPQKLQDILSVNLLDSNTQSDYETALSQLSNISSSLASVSKNPELYVATGSFANTPPTANSFLIPYSENLSQALYEEKLGQTFSNQGLINILLHPFDFGRDSPESAFFRSILTNFFVLNATWLVFIVLCYFLWIRRIFRPIHLIIDGLQNFSPNKKMMISYQKKNEFLPLVRTLNELNSSLEKQEQIRNQFLSDLSHEIRTPMTAISCFLEAINDGVMTLDRTTLLTLQSEMNRLVQISEKIMKHEGFLQEKPENLIRERIHILSLAEDVALQYQPKLQKTHQEILLNFSKKMVIYANKEQMMHVFHNIFSNFCKYAGENSKLFCECSKNKKFTRLIFRDTGIGISSEDLPFLGEKFYK